MPLVSVVSINYNNASGLEKTIRSVLAQEFSDYEFLIIDGGSTDGSTDVMNRYAGRVHFSISEKDKGIYDAQNKGIDHAKGEYIIFLNSGDRFYNETVLKEFAEAQQKQGKKIMYGNSRLLNTDGTAEILSPPRNIDLDFWCANTLNHQAVFTHRIIFEIYGKFNTQLKYTADFESLLKVFVKEPGEFGFFDTIVCDFDNSGVTSLDSYQKYILEERKKILKQNLEKEEYRRIRKKYLGSLPAKRKYMIMVRENRFLRMVISPVSRAVRRINTKK